MRWTELRPIQRDTIDEMSETLNHLIISASTASGKTEAAFLPILSDIVEDYQGSIKAIYVGPLKALINDQFRRLEDLCNYTEIPVHKWHGDASQACKQKVRNNPSGVLLITPESIESLFVNHSSKLKTMFSHLSYIVIDEMHSFIGTERGAHLKSLLSRLTVMSKQHVRLLGLSATLGDDTLAKQWLYPSDPKMITLIKGKGGDKTIHCQLKGYIRTLKVEAPESHASEEQEIKTPEDAKLAYRHLVKKYHPDLAPTPEERDNYTQHMKQINAAYHEGRFQDLGRLLSELDPQSIKKIHVIAEHIEKFDKGSEEDFTIASDIIRLFYGKTALIFANRRSDIEQYADIVTRILENENKPNCFYVHHGSLSKSEREFTEEALKTIQGTTAFCSSTLEMGIDVGNVSVVGQIGPTWSVNSLCQRLGRSGRRDGEASTLRMMIPVDEVAQKSDIVSKIYPDLLQGIALIELVAERWYEPPDIDRLHYSTFIQQIMSIVKEYGGKNASGIYEALVTKGAFRNIDKATFIKILRSMKEHDLIDQDNNDIILGLRGERIACSLDFYSAFMTPILYRVVHKGRLIGTIEDLPGGDPNEEDKYLILAGKRWKVLAVDTERLEIFVEPSKAGKVPKFGGGAGADVHTKVRQKMLEILKSNKVPAYLDETAKGMLHAARSAAQEAELFKSPFYQEGSKVIWFTWTGSKIHRTLWGLAKHNGSLKIDGIDGPSDDLTLCFESPLERVLSSLPQLTENPPSLEEIARTFPTRSQEKYDRYLAEELQVSLFAHNSLDLSGSAELITNMNFSSLVQT
jgi:ATP-dependent Lhr-like helicase